MGKIRLTGNLEETVRQLSREVNKLTELVKQTAEGKPKEQEKIRIVKDGNKGYKLEFKHEDGWIESTNTTITGFKRKEN